MAHHGMNDLDGIHAFCHYGHTHEEGDRFGRLFSLSPLYTPPDTLRQLGAQGGPMDGGSSFDRTDSVPVGQLFFGQFVDHDITLDVTSSLASVAEAGETPNVRTPALDLDNIYGVGPEATPYLYHGSGKFERVKLLTGADGTAVDQPTALAEDDLCRTPDGTAIIGDPRNDENGVISQLQLGMIRFHNAVVDTLHAEEGLEGHELYEEARKVTTWHYQTVIVEDYLPAICGQAVVDEIRSRGRHFFCPTTETPFIPIEFAVAAYRFGHSMMPQRVQVQKNGNAYELFGATLGRGFTPLSDADAVADWHELLDTDEDRNVQNAEELDTQLATDLLDLPFIHEGESSLATRNLLRGQTFLLPSGEQVARTMGRDPAEIEQVTEAARDRAEPDVELSGGTPLWYYILTEAEHIGRETSPGHFEAGEGLGPVGARIVGETLYGLIELDDRSFLGSNRNWRPEADGVGVRTLGEMMTYSS